MCHIVISNVFIGLVFQLLLNIAHRTYRTLVSIFIGYICLKDILCSNFLFEILIIATQSLRKQKNKQGMTSYQVDMFKILKTIGCHNMNI
jgi:hypothetical protein